MYIHHDYTVKKTKWEFRPLLLPQLKINFNFYINLRTSDVVVDRDWTALLAITPGASMVYYTSAAVDMFQGAVSCDHIQEAVAKAIAGSTLDGDHGNLMDLVLEELWEKFRNQTLPKSGVYYADVNIQVERFNISVGDHQDDDDYHLMVPAADSSIELLEKCDVDSVMCCSICMEDLSGATFKLPCSHVFHDSCIQKWLKISHYCPLCRYQLPTQ